MRKGINFGRPRANLSRKISKENTRNNCCLAKEARDHWNVHRNLLKKTKVGKRKTGDFSNTKLIQVQVSCWFTNFFLASPKMTPLKHLNLLACAVVCNFCKTTWFWLHESTLTSNDSGRIYADVWPLCALLQTRVASYQSSPVPIHMLYEEGDREC